MIQSKQQSHKPIEKFINKIIRGDSLKVLKTIPDESIDCVVTSPRVVFLSSSQDRIAG